MIICKLHRVEPETVALMMQMLGTNLPRQVRVVPYPKEEQYVKPVGKTSAYQEQLHPRQPNYINEYC